LTIESPRTDITTRRKFQIYVAQEKPFPDGILFVAYWHTEDSRNSLNDPFFYEHAARGDLECRIWVAEISQGFVWDFVSGIEVEEGLKAFLLDLDETRWADLQAFFRKCWNSIAEKPKLAFQRVFR
jgi:hypothetical protein